MPPPLSAGLFTLLLERGRYLVYAPLRCMAFIANARAVNVLADLQAGRHDPEEDPGGGLLPFLRRLQLLDARPDAPPLTPSQALPGLRTTSYQLPATSYQLPATTLRRS